MPGVAAGCQFPLDGLARRRLRLALLPPRRGSIRPPLGSSTEGVNDAQKREHPLGPLDPGQRLG